ncbi:MAG: hypothetical protein NTZ67_02895 [Gammaproteobacteria bacterium]|nr:hypothetical protein [Gammaproteobacteria bacterium]
MRIQPNATFKEITQAGRIFKVVKIERWNQLANALVDPELRRPNLPKRVPLVLDRANHPASPN